MVKSRNRDAHFHLIPYNMEGPRYTEPVLLFVFNNIFAYKIWGSDTDKWQNMKRWFLLGWLERVEIL